MINTATTTLVSAFILSRKDYCNSLLSCSTHDVIYHLQEIQNSTVRVISHVPKTLNINKHLNSFHGFHKKNLQNSLSMQPLPQHTSPYVTNVLQKLPLFDYMSSDSHTESVLRKRLVLVQLTLFRTLCQVLSGVSIHCHHFNPVCRHLFLSAYEH